MLTNRQIDILERNMRSLEYEKGEHILKQSKKKLEDECFLFIGAGGTGGKTLVRLKKEMQAQIEESEIKSKVRFLFVDTDSNDVEWMVKTDKELEESEVLQLVSNEVVRESIDPNGANWKNVKSWANEQLYGYSNTSAEFSGRGAGAVRQVGRAHITYVDNYDAYTTKIHNVITDLITGKTLTKLKVKVYFFAGIAGGTGSGTIIDLAIIARDVICSSFSSIKSNVKFYGNIFMPSACGRPLKTDDIIHGNRNAYAALKEIDYFSSLEDKGEEDVMQYGAKKVRVTKNLFDFCNIVEGNSVSKQVNPAAMVQDATVQSIINTIIRNSVINDPGMFLVDSIRSNWDDILIKIEHKPENQFPRNANYIYSVTGFSQCVVPTDLLCSFIMAKIYAELYKKFKDGAEFPNYSPQKKVEMFEKFIIEAQLDKKYVDVNGMNTNLIRENIDRTVGRWMELYGPFLLINFSTEFATYVRENYVAPISTKQSKKYVRRVHIWNMVAKTMDNYNNGLFDIYVNVIEEFKKILDSNGEILTDTHMYDRHFGAKSFSWSPIKVLAQNNNDAMSIYINSLLEQNMQPVMDAFCRELWKLKDKWGRLLDQGAMLKFDAAEDIRMFLQTHIGAIIQDSAQDFILKVYSGDPNATVANSSPQIFEKAAKNIYDEFTKRSNLMAQTSQIYDSINLWKRIVIPKDWKQLYNAIVGYNTRQGGYFQIYVSDIDDRIVCMKINNGVAAYMLNWTKMAEKAYEMDNKHIGLHMHQSDAGIDWVNEPNLYVESLWNTEEELTDGRKREYEIIKHVDSMMEHAKKDLGIIDEDEWLGMFPYSIYLFRQNIKSTDIDSINKLRYNVLSIIASEGQSSNHENLLNSEEKKYGYVLSDIDKQKLIAAGIMHKEIIMCGHMCMTMEGDCISSETRMKNRWHLTKQIVRRNTSLMRAVETTVAVLDALDK